MRVKIPPSEKLIKELKEKIREGGSSLWELIREGIRLMLQMGLEDEITELLGRRHYERREKDEELLGYRNGYERKTIQTAEGSVEVEMPQVRQAKKEFESRWIQAYMKRTENLEEMVKHMYVKGMSVRDIESSMADILSGEGISRSTVSRITSQLEPDFKAWQNRNLSKEDILYLFLDGAYWKVRDGSSSKEAILIAYGIGRNGKKVLLHLALGNKESFDSWLTFLHDMSERDLAEPLMVVYDGNPGVKKACRQVFPRSLKQRCQVHKMRNILAKLPRAVQAEMKKLIQKVFQAETYHKGLQAGKQLVSRFADRYPAAMECLEKDLEETLQCLKLPEAHRMRARNTNVLERLIEEAKRRTKVIPYFQKERICLKLVYATLLTASKLWRGVKMNRVIEKELATLEARILKAPKAA